MTDVEKTAGGGSRPVCGIFDQQFASQMRQPISFSLAWLNKKNLN